MSAPRGSFPADSNDTGSARLIARKADANYVVCGWYTPDYRLWWDVLRPTLEHYGAPHDFVEVEKLGGGWENNTLAKPRHLLNAMERHPDKVIVFLDVDCTVHGSLDPLAHIRGDVAFFIRTKRKKTHAKWGAIRNGTLVARPTEGARRFAELWDAQAANYADVDQDTLMFAVCDAPGCTFEPLPMTYCAVGGDKVANPIILHDSASAGIAKIGRLAKQMHRWGMPRRIVNAMPAVRTHV